MRLDLALLLATPLLAQDDTAGVTFTCEEGNYRLSYPRGWREVRSPADVFQLVIRRLGGTIFVSGVETAASPEAIAEVYAEEQELQADSFTEAPREETRVAGERAVRMQADTVVQGITMRFLATFFTHHGIAYRVVGVILPPGPASFERDYAALLDSFAFLGERSDWIDTQKRPFARRQARSTKKRARNSTEARLKQRSKSSFGSSRSDRATARSRTRSSLSAKRRGCPRSRSA
jgi:hypothetical protein